MALIYVSCPSICVFDESADLGPVCSILLLSESPFLIILVLSLYSSLLPSYVTAATLTIASVVLPI